MQNRPPEIIVQDFGEDMFELGTPKEVDHMLQFIVSPSHTPGQPVSAKIDNLDINWNEGQFKIPYDTNSCVLLNPRYVTHSAPENWEAVFQANGAEELLNGPEKKITDTFLSELGLKSPNSKVTLFSPKRPDELFSENFIQALGLNDNEVTLIAPKTPNLISTKTPVVLKRQNDGRDEFGIYLPPCFTPGLVETLQSTLNQEDGTMFPFPPVEERFQTNFIPDSHPVSSTARQIFHNGNSIYGQGHERYNSMVEQERKHIMTNTNKQMYPHPVFCSKDTPTPVSTVHSFRTVRSLPGTSTQRIPTVSTERIAPSRKPKECLGKQDAKYKNPTQQVKNKKTKLKELRQQFKEVRLLHNDVERKRRGEMHSRFQKLRESIPELVEDKKAAKIAILKVAKRYINDLDEEGRRLEELKEHEKRRNRELLDRLCKLTGTSSTAKT